MKTLSEAIGERLKALREAKGLSQAQLARSIGWSTASRIGNYEIGERKISADDAVAIGRALGVSPAELLFGDQSAGDISYGVFLTEKQEELLDVFESLPSEEAERFLAEMKKAKAHYDAIFEEMLTKSKRGKISR